MTNVIALVRPCAHQSTTDTTHPEAGRIAEAVRVLAACLASVEGTRSNYARWHIKDAVVQIEASHLAVALLALRKAVEHGRQSHCPPGLPEVEAARRALGLLTDNASPDTTHPETIRLHGLAENALSTALHCLRNVDCSPAKLQTATARAIRAATLLKRACMAHVNTVEG